jgi:hypothetical protein
LDSAPEPKDYSSTFPSAKSMYSIDNWEKDADTLTVRGWAILEGVPSDKISISLALVSDDDSVKLETKGEVRNDVSAGYHGSYAESGFISVLPIKGLPKGKYSLRITFSMLDLKRTVDTENSIVIE